MVGYNLAAMRFMKTATEQKEEGQFFEAAIEQQEKERSERAGANAPLHELRRKTAARAKKGSKRSRSG